MALDIRRREFVAGLGGATFAWPLAAGAQQRDAKRHLGVLMGFVANDPEGQADVAAFVEGLGAHSDPALLERYAAELVALGPDLLLAGSSSTAVAALQRRTSTIPVVFANITDPVGQAFVGSLAHPGGNITGFSNYDPLMVGKWLAMLTQLTPPAAHVAALYNPATTPYAPLLLSAIAQAASSLAVTVQAAPIKDVAEIEATMARLAREGRGGLLVLPDIFNNQHRDAIVALTAQHRLPAVYAFRFFVVAGGLMSYGIDIVDVFRRSAAYVDHILKGTAPADLPVQAPVTFKLVVNLKTAKALDLTVAPTLLVAADEVIE